METRRWLAGSVAAMVGAIAVGGGVATADPPSPFGQLRQLERKAERHRLAAERLEREAERRGARVAESIDQGRLADRAADRLKHEVADRLVRWETLHRRIDRRRYRWRPGEGSDLRRLLAGVERAALERRRESFAALRRLERTMPVPESLMGERARRRVELAQHRASEQTAEAERERFAEETTTDGETGDEAIEEAMQRAQHRLERSLEQLIDHETGEDFHRKKGTLLPPVSAEPNVGFGRREQEDSPSYVRHTGLTYEIEEGRTVRAIAEGLVVFAERLEGYGKLVIVDHGGGYHSLYAHLDEIAVKADEEVGRGAQLGSSGATGSLEGPKLYVELRADGEPIDPAPWFIEPQED